MATFTLRVPALLADSLRSAEMRSWLEDFIRKPHTLPPDPGPGDERISLTLPEPLVNAVSAYCACSPSAALRRVAAGQLAGDEAQDQWADIGEPNSPIGIQIQKAPSEAGAIAGLVIQLLLVLLFVGLVLFLRSRRTRKSHDEYDAESEVPGHER